MTLAELIAGLLASQEASLLMPDKIYSMKLVLSDDEEVNGAKVIGPNRDGDYEIVLSDGIRD